MVAPFSIIYGLMVHTAFFGDVDSALASFERMKADLSSIIELSDDDLTAAMSEFCNKY